MNGECKGGLRGMSGRTIVISILGGCRGIVNVLLIEIIREFVELAKKCQFKI